MIEQTQTLTWQSKIKALGPGILMASAAVGGSHIVSSAQAGAHVRLVPSLARHSYQPF